MLPSALCWPLLNQRKSNKLAKEIKKEYKKAELKIIQNKYTIFIILKKKKKYCKKTQKVKKFFTMFMIGRIKDQENSE